MEILLDPTAPEGLGNEQRPAMQVNQLTTRRLNRLSSLPATPGLGREVKTVATKPRKWLVGIVTITARSTPKQGRSFYELRYRDPATDREVKRRVSGLELDEVKAIAFHLTSEALQGRGYLAGRSKAPEIQEAISQALELSRGNAATRKDAAGRAMAFVSWLEVNHPKVKTWDELRPIMLQSYVHHCEKQGLAWDSIRLRLQPIRAAWRLMHENYGEQVKPLVQVRMPQRPRVEIDCLTPAEVAALLSWLKARGQLELWVAGTLAALCGLRMREANFMRRQDIDLSAHTITVTDTGMHKPKTRDSWRTIPICGMARKALIELVDSQKVIPNTGELFSLIGHNALSWRWAAWLPKAATELSMPRLGEVPPRKLRAFFATTAGRLGVPDRLLKAYMGHTAGDMLGMHYMRIGVEDLRPVCEAMECWQDLSDSGGIWKHPGNIEAEVAMEG